MRRALIKESGPLSENDDLSRSSLKDLGEENGSPTLTHSRDSWSTKENTRASFK